MKRRKILFVLPSLVGGGAERVFVHLMNHLNRQRFEIILVVLKRKGPYFSSLREDVPVISLESDVLGCWFGLARVIKENRPDVVISTPFFFNIYVALARLFLLGQKTVFIARETGIPSVRNTVYRNILFSDSVFRLAYKFFHTVVCQSNDMFIDVQRKYKISSDKMLTINNPVDVCYVESLAESGSFEFQSGGAINLIAVGSLHAQKGFDFLLRAFQRVNRKDVHLHIIGEGVDRSSLEALSKELCVDGRVTFHGFLENPYAVMKQADALILSSKWEGFPNVLIEAMALGCPVVAVDCPGGINEIVRDGENGVLVEPGSVKSMSKAIDSANFLTMDRADIAADIKERFSLNKIIAEYEGLFSRCGKH
ncbi:glycosyltransferase [Desulforhopalus singaporensis]|uniref:Glycosyltransferase involved in cell wall bisynthesis n=1 Tax=Desulforhopalus singaporensis TaxID=91360 RepID=A0A1H0UXU3_9BACT|nr:glycosyltransferase [Desulforhopalus singaporensis]SDP70921.1 Glycosyltransferase involved in cell wall bisynthesis [Desulforhopalus singaporensis]